MKGYDEFMFDPGKQGEVKCKVCQDDCKFRGTRYGPRSYASAMAGTSTDFDYFECLSRNEDWHRQALALIQEINSTPSARLATMLREELQEVLANKTPTKTDGY